MFSRIAETVTGANCLIDFRILELLGECQYLDRYPDFSLEFNESMFPITAHDTFHDIFTAVLELILGLMTHNLPNQAQIFDKVIAFINKHYQTFIAILKNSNSLITLSYLFELKLITGIFTLLGSSCREFIAKPIHGPGNVSFISLMIQVLTKFSTQEWRSKFVPTSDVEKEKQKSHVLVYVSGSDHSISQLNVLEEEGTRLSEEICRNILGVIKNNISGKSQKGMYFNNYLAYEVIEISLLSNLITQKASVLLQNLNENAALKSKSKLSGFPLEEINDVARRLGTGIFDELSMNQRQQLYVGHIHNRSKCLLKDIDTLLYIIETSSIILAQLWNRGYSFDIIRPSISAIEAISTSDLVVIFNNFVDA
jgi:hypothetical protein